MTENRAHLILSDIESQLDTLTPKARVLGRYIICNPLKVVFMTTKELSEACDVSEATVVRFVSQLGYNGYSEFSQGLRDFVDTKLSMPDRIDMPGMKGPGSELLHRVVSDEIKNLQWFWESVDMEVLAQIVQLLKDSTAVYVTGSRASFAFAHYLGWSLTKVRRGVHILKGSDSASIDWLTNAPGESLVTIIATSRYPNELIKLGKVARRLEHQVLLITDNALCPVIPFAHLSLVIPSRSIPLIGSPSSIFVLINYLMLEMVKRGNTQLRAYQQNLEQVYLENDILFNIHGIADQAVPSQNPLPESNTKNRNAP
jgi:DNA-binding MurR/RpiR family transcriptional regulator